MEEEVQAKQKGELKGTGGGLIVKTGKKKLN